MRIKYGSCAVLLYHRVADLQTDPQLLSVGPDNFKQQLSILKTGFHLLSVEEFKNHLRIGKKFPEKSVLITFDDGYADNYLNAEPVLKAHEAEALFYICTGNIGTSNEFWWDELERLLLLPEKFPSAFVMDVLGNSYTCSNLIDSRLRMYLALLPVLRKTDFVMREGLFSQIRKQIPDVAPRESHRSVTQTELKKMSESTAVTIGAHTVNHCSLKWLDKDGQKVEIQKSIRTLESITSKKIIDFSYPFGTGNDFSNETVAICKNAGMEFVAANIPGCVHAKSNPFSFPRFLVRNWNGDEFRNHLNSFFN